MLGRVTIGHTVQWTPTACALGHPWKSLDNTSVAMMMMVTMVIGGGSYENSDEVGGDLDCDDDDNDILDM